MPTPAADTGGPRSFADAARGVAEHASSLARLEIELAVLELKAKLTALGLGIGLGLGAALVLLYALGFGLAAAAVALSIVLDAWLALLLVTAGLLALAALLAYLALRAFKRGTPPVPEQAIEEARVTSEALRGDGGV